MRARSILFSIAFAIALGLIGWVIAGGMRARSEAVSRAVPARASAVVSPNEGLELTPVSHAVDSNSRGDRVAVPAMLKEAEDTLLVRFFEDRDRSNVESVRRNPELSRQLILRFRGGNSLLRSADVGPLRYRLSSGGRALIEETMISLPGDQTFPLGSTDEVVKFRLDVHSNVGAVLPLLELERELASAGDTELVVDLSAIQRPQSSDIRLVLDFADIDFDVQGSETEIYACDPLGQRLEGAKKKRIDLYSWRLGDRRGVYELLCRDLPPGNYTLTIQPLDFEHTFQVVPTTVEWRERISVPPLHRISVTPRNEAGQLLEPGAAGEMFWGDLGEASSRELFESMSGNAVSAENVELARKDGRLHRHPSDAKRWRLHVLPGRELWLHLRGKRGSRSRTLRVDRTSGVSEVEWVVKKD